MVIVFGGLFFGLVQSSRAASITVAAGVVDIDGADGQCSLIEAIENANNDAATHADCPAGSGADIIELATGATYDLTSAAGGTALPTISDELTIKGHNATIRKVNAASYRLMANAQGNVLEITDLTLRDGYALTGGGGAILNKGHLTVRRSTFLSNHSHTKGGAIFVDARGASASLMINNSTFDSNGATEEGGAIFMSFDESETFLQINNSEFTDNSSNTDGGAIYGDGDNWRLEVRNSTFTNNSADSDGGAIYFFIKPADGVIAYSTFENNEAENGAGGAIYAKTSATTRFTFDHLTMTNNSAATAGGAMVLGHVTWGNFHVTASTFDGNNANYGGAISADHVFTLTQVALRNNASIADGGAIDVRSGGTSTAIGMVEYCEISGNTAGQDGGGVHIEPSDHLTLRHSTLSGNEAGTGGGAIDNTGTISVTFATIVDNDANRGGGFRNVSSGVMVMRNTALMENRDGGLGTNNCSNDGTFTSLGYNRYVTGALSGCIGLFGEATDASVAVPSDHIDLTLADNGGPTHTHAIVQNGDLHNQIPNGTNGCQAGVSLDQRGYVRANGPGAGGARCDVGAYEYAAICATPVAPDVNISPAGADVFLSWTQPAENFYTELWRTASPYFDPASPGNQVPFNTLDASYSFADQLGDVELNRFYAVRGVAGCGDVSAGVDRVGEFDFALVPGN